MSEVVFTVRAIDEASNTLQKIEGSANRTAQNIASAFMNFAGKAVAGVFSFEFLRNAVTNASDLTETVNRLAIAFGDLEQANKIIKSLQTELGLSQKTAMEFLSNFKIMLTSLGLTEDTATKHAQFLTQLATDIASFYNISLTEASSVIQSALAGQFESLRKFGIVINENVIKVEALKRGWEGQLSVSQRTAIVLDILREKFGHAIGDATRTADSFANTSRRIVERIQDLLANVGQGLLVTIAPLLRVIEEVLKGVNYFFAEIVNKIPILQSAITALIVGLSAAIVGGGPIGLIVGALTFIVSAVIHIIQRWSVFVEAIQLAWEGIQGIGQALWNIVEIIGSVVMVFVQAWMSAGNVIKQIILNAVSFVIEKINAVLQAVGLGKLNIQIQTQDIGKTFQEENERVKKAIANVGTNFQKMTNNFSKGLGRIGEGISKIAKIFTSVEEKADAIAQKPIPSTPTTPPTTGGGGKKEEKDTISQRVEQALQPLGGILGALTENIKNSFINLISSLVGSFGSLFGVLDITNISLLVLGGALNYIASTSPAVQQLANLFTLLSQLIGALIVPILNTLVMMLQPLINILYVAFTLISVVIQPFVYLLADLFLFVGEILGVITQLLGVFTPVFQVVAMLLQTIFAVIRPFIPVMIAIVKVFATVFNYILLPFINLIIIITNGIIAVVGGIVNGVIWVINGIIDAINWALGWAGVNIRKIGYINTTPMQTISQINTDMNIPQIDMNNPASSLPGGGGGMNQPSPMTTPSASSSGVSVQQPAPIYVTFNNYGVLAGFRNEDEFIDWIRRGFELAGRRV